MKIIMTLTAVMVFQAAFAWAGERQAPASWNESGLASVEHLPVQEFAAIDPAMLRKLDADEDKAGRPLRFAVPNASDAGSLRDGSWETLAGGDRLWRMRFVVPGATDINFGFARMWLPPGATLHIYDADRSFFQGPWDATNNKAHGQFWTPVVPGESAVIELRVPAGAALQPVLTLQQVAAGYRDLFGRAGGPYTRGHGDCNIDTVCPEGDDWRDEIRSVARYTNSGLFLCTGTLINDVPRSLTPHFLTANHCLSTPVEAAGVVVYWNFEAPVCGQQDGGSLDQNQSGSILAATRQDVDMTLLILDDDPDESFNVHFAGWDRSNDQPGGAVGIHHPRGHVKSISFALSDLDSTPNCVFSGIEDTHWHVPFWNEGTTEPGSSGSGIWNPQNQRLIGFLTGGAAACGNQAHDCYGKFAVAWDGLVLLQRLRDWLDPEGLEPDGVDGTDPVEPLGFNLVPEATQFSQCGFDDLAIEIAVTREGDFDDPVSMNAAGLPDGVTAQFDPDPVIPPGDTVLTLGNLESAGTGDFGFAVQGTSGDLERSRTLIVSLSDNVPAVPQITMPADGATGVPLTPAVEWMAAGGAFQYELQIAADAEFSDLAYSALEFDAEHEVASPLAPDAQHFLRLRALNDCGEGGWSETVSFTTEALPGDCPQGTQAGQLFYENFSGGEIPAGWSTLGSVGTVTWSPSVDQSFDGAHAMFAENIGLISDQRLATPAIALPDGADPLFLTFQNWQHIESSADGCFDGGLLEISTDGGLIWEQVEAQILAREYDGPIAMEWVNPLAGMPAWCGDPRAFWERYAVDLSSWAGQEVRFRFRFGTDALQERVGWYVDAVEVRKCEVVDEPEPPENEVFLDRFEAADE